MTDEPRTEITFKYFDEQDAYLALSASCMYSALYEIDQLCRSQLKHGDGDENLDRFAQEIRDLVHMSIDMDRIR